MLVLIGESGSGKSTLETLIAGSTNLQKSISYTTRPKRSDELEGRDYHFRTEEEFDVLEEDKYFVEVEEYHEWKYGLPLSECGNDKVAVLTLNGFRKLRQYINDNKLDIQLYSIYKGR